MKIEWSPRARDELLQLHDYIAQDSPFYARQFTERVIRAAERLADHPRLGRPVPEAGYLETIREVIVQGYRIVYRLKDDQVQIVTLLHGSRDLAGQSPPPWIL
jgi:toxin ParE1/3/4